MTFRTRLVLAATTAVVLAVLAASSASYFAARNSLLNAADNSLADAAAVATRGQGLNQSDVTAYQVIDASGFRVAGGGLPVTSNIRSVAANHSLAFFTTVTVSGYQLREFIEHLPTGTTVGSEILTNGGALQLATLYDVNQQLSGLGLTLGAVALSGTALAILLGWLVARTALIPLDELTQAMERIAETTDVSERLSAEGRDELGRLRRSFNKLLAAVGASRDAQNQLVLDASHELRTPLTSLRTNMEVLRRIDELSLEDRNVLIDDVLIQLGELTDLVGDLAELTRGAHLGGEPEIFRLDGLLEDSIALANTHGRTQNITFILDSQECWVRARPDRIARAIGNLLDNARKWSPEGGLVEVTCRDGEVVVHDHGPGFSEDDLPHIFDRFYRASAARGLPGSGLGLAIVAQVAANEGGSVTAETSPEGGAIVKFNLPPFEPSDDT